MIDSFSPAANTGSCSQSFEVFSVSLHFHANQLRYDWDIYAIVLDLACKLPVAMVPVLFKNLDFLYELKGSKFGP
jgi:hypothetical protein